MLEWYETATNRSPVGLIVTCTGERNTFPRGSNRLPTALNLGPVGGTVESTNLLSGGGGLLLSVLCGKSEEDARGD